MVFERLSRDSLISFLEAVLILPRYKQVSTESINRISGTLLASMSSELGSPANHAIRSSIQIFNEWGFDPVRHFYLIELADRIEWILSELKNTRDRGFYRRVFSLESGSLVSWSMRYDFTHQLGFESESLIANLKDPKVQQRLIFGPRFNSNLNLRVELNSQDLGNPVSEEDIHSMASLCNKRVIDRSKKCSQLGFGRVITEEEISSSLKYRGSYLIKILLDDYPIHYALLQSELKQFTDYRDKVMELLVREGEAYSDRFSWLDLVVSAPAASRYAMSEGISVYGLSCYFMSILLAYTQTVATYCTCRSGEYANTALQRTLSHGFDDTGIEISSETLQGYSADPAKVLRFDPYRLKRISRFVLENQSHDLGVHSF